MSQTMLQFLLTIMMYSIMGLVVGIGVVLVKKYPKLGELLDKHPIFGWTIGFAAGSVVMTLVMAVVDVMLITLLSYSR
jgi:membrane protease YdiL (CAAX protease family)